MSLLLTAGIARRIIPSGRLCLMEMDWRLSRMATMQVEEVVFSAFVMSIGPGFLFVSVGPPVGRRSPVFLSRPRFLFLVRPVGIIMMGMTTMEEMMMMEGMMMEGMMIMGTMIMEETTMTEMMMMEGTTTMGTMTTMTIIMGAGAAEEEGVQENPASLGSLMIQPILTSRKNRQLPQAGLHLQPHPVMRTKLRPPRTSPIAVLVKARQSRAAP